MMITNTNTIMTKKKSDGGSRKSGGGNRKKRKLILWLILSIIAGCWLTTMIKILLLQAHDDSSSTTSSDRNAADVEGSIGSLNKANATSSTSSSINMTTVSTPTIMLDDLAGFTATANNIINSNNNNKINQTTASASVSVATINNNNNNNNRNKKEEEDAAGKKKKKKDKKMPNPEWYKSYVTNYVRVWSPQSPMKWCILDSSDSEKEEDSTTTTRSHRWSPPSGEKSTGLLYVKTYKTGSSTCEGIAWNIAYHMGQRMFNQNNVTTTNTTTTTTTATNDSAIIQHSNTKTNNCIAYTRHEFSTNRFHGYRMKNSSLLWSFVRNPRNRDISHVYHFQIGRESDYDLLDPINFQKYLETKVKGRQTRYLYPTKLPSSGAKLWPKNELRGLQNKTQFLDLLQKKIINNYDFLGITERMVESLAVMVILWQLDVKDVIVLDSKRSGGYDDGGGNNNTCTKIPKPTQAFVDETNEYFTTRHKYWNSDYWLYEVVNESLDITIAYIGKDRVDDVVNQIQTLQGIANDKCTSKAIFPCSSNGTYQYDLAQTSKMGCYIQDAGCGHNCIDNVLNYNG